VADIDWDDVQGNVLRGYRFDHAHHLVLSIGDPEQARRLLRRLTSAVTPSAPWYEKPDATLNLAFTHRGLAALGLDGATLASFPEEFREGMLSRSRDQLGDVEADDPEHWEAEGVHHPSAHVLVMVHGNSVETADEQRSQIVADALDHGFGLVATEHLNNLAGPGGWAARKRIEHFGFADGVSQPAVEGARQPSIVEGNGTLDSDGKWRPVRTGEFLLGFPNEENDVPPLPQPETLSRNGTYLVYRKLSQDVAGFRRLVAERAARHSLAAELLAAKLMGRETNGAPLHPDGAAAGEQPGVDADGADYVAVNDFCFGDDDLGRGCPVASHVRRANPRDGLGLSPELVSRHRMLRRGMPYGPPLPEGVLEDDGVERGLMFLAYCADISRQFEFVQREWLNDGNAMGVGHTADPIAGHGTSPRTFAFEAPDGSGPVVLADLPSLVRVRAGEYLFQPSLTGLRYLSGADDDVD
jgi:Dyp-type peroxidase family